jgi:hypothetical protein
MADFCKPLCLLWGGFVSALLLDLLLRVLRLCSQSSHVKLLLLFHHQQQPVCKSHQATGRPWRWTAFPRTLLLPQPLQTRLVATGAFLGLETEFLRGGDDIGEKAQIPLSRIGLGWLGSRAVAPGVDQSILAAVRGKKVGAPASPTC